MKTKGGPRRWERPLRGVTGGLVVKLQSELDLPGVIGSVAGGANFTEIGIAEIGGSGDGDHTVAAEPRSVKVGMVGNVEYLRPKLEAHALVERNVLEDGEVKAMESRSGNLCWATAQRRNPTIDKRRSNRCLCTLRWLSEGFGISKPAKLSICVCMQTHIQGLPTHKEIVAACPRGGAVGATKRDWLATLQGGDPLNAPAAYELVRSTRSARHEFLAFAEGELIPATEMEDVADIERSQSAILLNPHTWNVGSPIPPKASTV